MIYNPLPHQVLIREFLRGHPRGALFAGMGLGKSAAILDHLDHLISSGSSKGALIVAPLRVAKITWPNQIAQWDNASWLRAVNLNTPEGMEAWEAGDADLYITHFDTLSTRELRGERYPGVLEKCFHQRKSAPADTIIIDESSAFKSHDSKRGRDLRAVLKFFPRRYLLTGTPAPNSYFDLQPQIRLLDDGERLGRSFHQFRQHYGKSDFMGFKWELKAGAKATIDSKLSDICLTLSAEDWLKVPPCSVVDIPVVLPPAARTAYKKMERDFLTEVDSTEVVALNAAVKVGKLMQLCSGSVYDEGGEVRDLHGEKVQALKKLIASLNGEPLLVFIHYKHETARLLREIEGAEAFDERRIPEWQAGKIKVWLASPASMSHGIDGIQLGGRHACWFTPTYSNEQYQQANARLVRQGQERETVVHRILATDTIDEAVVETLREKEDGQKGLMTAVKNLRLLRK